MEFILPLFLPRGRPGGPERGATARSVQPLESLLVERRDWNIRHDSVPRRGPRHGRRTRGRSAPGAGCTARLRPRERAMPRSNSSTPAPAFGSRLATGSSATMKSGSCASARAIATRCCCPPDKRVRALGCILQQAHAVEAFQREQPVVPLEAAQPAAPGRNVPQPSGKHVLQRRQPAHQVELLKDDRDPPSRSRPRNRGDIDTADASPCRGRAPGAR